ncbi:hypothetical protein ACFFWC_30415 [Plantactinospora siamensis]|uniref:Uncharacterized protein n=1 Tax=Plantactinospora siamensis TaxID=555372 RepID=A0ABV6P670_9ACTN
MLSRLEWRVALYILVILFTTAVSIGALVELSGWSAAILPVGGTICAIQYGRTLPRRAETR